MPIQDNDNRNSTPVDTAKTDGDVERKVLAFSKKEYNVGDESWYDSYSILQDNNGKLYYNYRDGHEVNLRGEEEVDIQTAKQKIAKVDMQLTADGQKFFENLNNASVDTVKTDLDAENNRVEAAVKPLVEKPGASFTEDTSEKEAPQTNADISEIRVKADKSVGDYLAIHKSLVQKQQSTMLFYKGFAQRRIEKLGKLIGKQEDINGKIQQRENRAAKYENKITRLTETNKMLTSLFENKKVPAVISFIIDSNEKRIAKLHDKKIPQNNLKIQKLQGKSAKNHIKMEQTIAKADKLQALSSALTSFTVREPTKRREQFTAAMDDLHSASKRDVACKIEKCNAKIALLKSTLPENQVDYSISNIEAEDKIQRLEAKVNTLTQKMDKLQSLQQPFSDLKGTKAERLLFDVNEKIDDDMLKQGVEIDTEKQCSDFAEGIAVFAVEDANDLFSEMDISAEVPSKPSAETPDKSPQKDQKKQSLDERINKARADNPQLAVKQDKQQIKQDQSL
ncbi:MAG: hypothetical protein K2J80_12525 [Oscillospiraceae bacterium]|nr:hypothetical protein [Oscillospiraceae bacterium]